MPITRLVSMTLTTVLHSIRRFWLRYFSETGLVLRRINYLLNVSIHRKLIQSSQRESRNYVVQSIVPDTVKIKVDELRKFGYTRITTKELKSFKSHVQELKEMLEPIIELENRTSEEVCRDSHGKSKTYWVDLFKQRFADNNFDAVKRFLSCPEIIYIVAAYLDQIPILQELGFYYTPSASIGGGQEPKYFVGSQNWHLDTDSPQRVKIFYSPLAIGNENGPTTILSAIETGKVRYPKFPDYFTDRDALKARIDFSRTLSLTSDAEEFWMVDTSRCFHYGSRTTSGNRFLLIAGFVSLKSYLYPKKLRTLVGVDFGFTHFNSHLNTLFRKTPQNH